MELSELVLNTDDIKYDYKEKRITVEILGFTFLAHYQPSEKISNFLDDIYATLKEVKMNRQNIYIRDHRTQQRLSEDIKIKNLRVLSKETYENLKKEEEGSDKEYLKQGIEEQEKLEEFLEKKAQKTRFKEDRKPSSKKKKAKPSRAPRKMESLDLFEEEELLIEDTNLAFPQPIEKSKEVAAIYERPPIDLAKSAPAPPTPPPSPEKEEEPTYGDFLRSAPIDMMEENELEDYPVQPTLDEKTTGDLLLPPKKALEGEYIEDLLDEDYREIYKEPVTVQTERKYVERKVKVLNMGMQYYSVVMEEKNYLFYVFISEKELIIMDEVGKTVYKTTFEIEITKPEPPRIHVKLVPNNEEDFEIHPIESIIEIKEDQRSQPTLIFSINALKKSDVGKTKKELKKGDKRVINIIIEFEEKVVSHTAMVMKVQPKHFALDLGPIQLNLSKTQALMISILSMVITGISTVYTLLTTDFSTSSAGGLEGMIPGGGSLIFLVSFLVTLLKKGVFPMKHKLAEMGSMNKPAIIK